VARNIQYLTAETEKGRNAIRQAMQHSYVDEIDRVPARWTIARVVDGQPVSWIQADPDRRMEFPRADLRYAFIVNVATRESRRGEGHFRGIMEHLFSALLAEGITLVLTHGIWSLYRRFGFDVFTHHCGIAATPEGIERQLGERASDEGRALLEFYEHPSLQPDLLLISDVQARTLSHCQAALVASAAEARQRGKARILFEHPAAPSYGSRYPIYTSLETPFTALARACGAQVCIQGADPESGSIPDADWIKVLDARAFVAEALTSIGPQPPLPRATVALKTDSGMVTIESRSGRLIVTDKPVSGAQMVQWPASKLGQLVTGYQRADVLATRLGTSLGLDSLALLSVLFPRCWRLSRNESWIFAT
jgi:GNAT superfamily N-acetyltransferase